MRAISVGGAALCATQARNMCCRLSGECLLKWGALSLVVGALFAGGVQFWLSEKHYIFSAEDLASITIKALENNKKGGHDAVFAQVEEELRQRYSSHILPKSQMEWIFINAGGWMGAMYLLHASTSEYVLFFGTAIDTSGHSGRYWANITDTVISGKYAQWKEGTTKVNVYGPGETVVHLVGEATAMQWTAPFWAVEYGRGFIPSTLGFALSDTIFSTRDFYILYKIFRVYSIALVQEILQGNL